MPDDDQSPVIGTVSRPVTLDEALNLWRVKQDDDPIKESAGRALATWLLNSGQHPHWQDFMERYRFAAWCDVRGINGVAKAMRTYAATREVNERQG